MFVYFKISTLNRVNRYNKNDIIYLTYRIQIQETEVLLHISTIQPCPFCSILKPNNEREVVALYKMRKGGDDVGFIVFLVEFILKDNMTCFRAKSTKVDIRYYTYSYIINHQYIYIVNSEFNYEIWI